MLNPEHETFEVHVAFLSFILLNGHLSCRPQISGLITEKSPTKVLDKYIDFADIFSSDLASKLSKHIMINGHAIELVNS